MADIMTRANLQELKKAAALAADAWNKCAKAEAAGIDVGEDKERCGHLQQSIQQLLNVYDASKNWSTDAVEGPPKNNG